MSTFRKIGVVLGLLDDEPEPTPDPIGASFRPPDEICRALYYLKDDRYRDSSLSSLFDLFFHDSYFESRAKFWRWLRAMRQGEGIIGGALRVEMIRLDVRVGDRWVRYDVDETAERLVLHREGS